MPGASTTPGPLGRAVAAVLEARRVQVGLTQKQVGAAIGRHQTKAGEILHGQRPLNVDQLDALCSLLGVPPAQVLREARELMKSGRT